MMRALCLAVIEPFQSRGSSRVVVGFLRVLEVSRGSRYALVSSSGFLVGTVGFKWLKSGIL